MFDNIGYKIKVIAKLQYLLFVLCCIVSGIYLISIEFVFLGILVFVLGVLATPISSFILYGFGELIDKVSEISENTKRDNSNSYYVEKNGDESVKKFSRVNYFSYVVLAFVTLITSVVIAMFAFRVTSSSNEGYIETIPYITIEYNDGQQVTS